ncbi:MAG: hypothetical protein ABJH75_19530, partial [Roseibium sp.]|uniref:hypothetical protein n=1 Tax=Roseibium sp. TaxID=1936156 RepID=UPI003296CC0E
VHNRRDLEGASFLPVHKVSNRLHGSIPLSRRETRGISAKTVQFAAGYRPFTAVLPPLEVNLN